MISLHRGNKALSTLLPSEILRLLYFTLAYSIIIYGITIWGSGSSHLLNSILLIQKKFIRIITKSEWLAHTTGLFKELKILKLPDLININVCVFMFKLMNYSKNDNSFKDIMLENNINNNYNTRQDNIRLPKYLKSRCQKSILYFGPKLWNNLLKKL